MKIKCIERETFIVGIVVLVEKPETDFKTPDTGLLPVQIWKKA